MHVSKLKIDPSPWNPLQTLRLPCMNASHELPDLAWHRSPGRFCASSGSQVLPAAMSDVLVKQLSDALAQTLSPSAVSAAILRCIGSVQIGQ